MQLQISWVSPQIIRCKWKRIAACVRAYAQALVCFVITHRAVADVFIMGGSDGSLYVGVMQEAVWQHDMKGEETTPGGEKRD